jgi:hypothetical protein
MQNIFTCKLDVLVVKEQLYLTVLSTFRYTIWCIAKYSCAYMIIKSWLILHLGFIKLTWPLRCYALPKMIKKQLEIKFHLNENIEWHCMQLELNWNTLDSNPLELDSYSIKLSLNLIEEKWDANWSKKYWKFACHFFPSFMIMVLKEKKIKRQKKHLSIPSKANSKPKSNLVEWNSIGPYCRSS